MQIVERYDSFQGSGALLGTPQHFVRLAGCSIACPIRKVCDEPQALDATAGTDISIDEIILGTERLWIHLSGGEPLEQRDEVEELANRHKVHIQTSGLLRFGGASWVTCSPKAPASRLKLEHCDELIVVAHPKVTAKMLDDWAERYTLAQRFLMPLWGDETTQCRRLMQDASHEWRLTIQAHKYWGLR